MVLDNSRDLASAPSCEPVEVQWVFRKNCSLTPQQLLAWYLSLCAITLVIAGGFWLAGYWIVLPFAGLELSLVALAFVVYARHAADYEMVQLSRYQLKITSASGSKLTEITLSPQWVRLDYDGKYKAPLVLSHQGEKIKFGRYIAERDKPSMHKELRAALVKAACGTL